MSEDIATKEYEFSSWEEFEESNRAYFQVDSAVRHQFIFRGQSNQAWNLAPSLDRRRTFASASERESVLGQLIEEFRRQSLGLPLPLGTPQELRQWELLGRHHGLASTILDWTDSIYIAAFFAFADPICLGGEKVVIWVFNRSYFIDEGGSSEARGDDIIEILDDTDDYRFNLRAVEQQAIYMKVPFGSLPLEKSLGSHLWKFILPTSIRDEVLDRASEMRINHRLLFRDLDSAARTSEWKVLRK